MAHDKKKFCVFCGGPPYKNHKEHVLPKWLIQLTGNPNRKGNFSVTWNDDTIKQRAFAFKELKFPACRNCNNEFSDFEDKAKKIVVKMLSYQPLSANELEIVFDFMDKVRIGIWLGYHLLNTPSVEPNFYIKQRIGKKDRMLAIYKTTDFQKGLTLSNLDTLSFHLLPCSFILRINDLCFFNLSFDFLFSRRMGLPFIDFDDELDVQANGRFGANIKHGKGKIKYPLINFNFAKPSTELYQCNIDNEHLMKIPDEFKTNHFNEMINKNGKGKIFQNFGRKLEEYSKEPSKSWIPNESNNLDELFKRITTQVFLAQNYLLNNFSIKMAFHLPSGEGKKERKLIRKAICLNKMLIKNISN